MPQISYRRLIQLLAGVCFLLGAAGAARADTSSSCFVNGTTSGGTGNTNCSVVVDSNNYASAKVIPGTANVGATVADVGLGSLATANAQNDDLFFCPSSGGCFVPGVQISPMVRYTFQLDGTASATAGFMELDASYTGLPFGGSGGRFTFSFFEDPGKGPSADTEASATFSPAGGSTIQIPVTLTKDANGNYNFSLDYTTPATPLCSPPGCQGQIAIINAAPVIEFYGDSESVAAQISGDGTPQFLNAISTFTVGITSLDPNFQPVSLDGRTFNVQTATTPEPASFLLLASGLAALFLLTRAHRY